MKKSIFLCLIVFVLLLSSCSVFTNFQTDDSTNAGSESGSNTSTDTKDVNHTDTSREIELVKKHDALYQIIYPKDCSPQVAAAADALRSKLLEVTGIPFFMRTDNMETAGEGEIVIGNCNRTEMRTALSAITYRDYAVTATDSNILIAGYEDSKVADAVYSFINQLTKDNLVISNGNVVLKWKGDYSKLYTNYKFDSLTIQEVDLSKYRIVYPAGLNLDEYMIGCAENLQNGIGRRSGAYVPIVSDAEPAQAYEILLGETNRTESTQYYAGADGPDSMECGLTVRNKKLLIACGAMSTLSATVLKFDNYLNSAKDGKLESLNMNHISLRNVSISECGGDYRIMSFNVMHHAAGWSGNLALLELPFATRAMNVALQVNQSQPDVLFLQERFEEWAGVGTDAVDFAKVLGDEYVVIENQISYSIANGQIERAINRSPIIYNSDTFRLIESGHKILTERVPTQSSSVKATVTWAVLEDVTNTALRGQRIVVCCTHWGTSQTLGGEDNVWLQQLQSEETQAVLWDVLEEYGSLPVMFGGDLNMHYSFDVYQNHLTVMGMQDADATINGAANVQDVVDHIAVSGAEIKAYKILNEANDCSDHYPIYCDVKIR